MKPQRKEPPQYGYIQTLLFLYIASISGLYAVFSQKSFILEFFNLAADSETARIVFILIVTILFAGLFSILLSTDPRSTPKERGCCLKVAFAIICGLLFLLFGFILSFSLFLVAIMLLSFFMDIQELNNGLSSLTQILYSLLVVLVAIIMILYKKFCVWLVRVCECLFSRK